MVIKVYISAISASKEVKKRQQRAQFILDSLKIDYENIDITEPEHEDERQRMKDVCKKIGNDPPLPPQFFNENDYCGDWFDFEVASEDDTVPVFLKLENSKDWKDDTLNSKTQLIESSKTNNEKLQEVDNKKMVDENLEDENLNEEKHNTEESE